MNEVRCSCGRVHDSKAWEKLPLVGYMPDGEGGELELRNCNCGLGFFRVSNQQPKVSEP